MSDSIQQAAQVDLLEEAEVKLAARMLDEALEAFHAAEREGADPDRCGAGRWSAHMLRGDFGAAWRESDALRKQGASDPHRFWQGEPLHGQRVIVRCLHGFGDAIQFLRYLPCLRKIASAVILEVPPRLVPLARFFQGADEVITWGEHAPATPVEWTVQLEVMELPYIFRTEMHDLPLASNYLQLPRQAPREDGVLRVGVVGNAGTWNVSRSIPSSCLQPIFHVHGCEFWDLRDADGVAATGALHDSLQIDSHCHSSIEGLAARIKALDLVITVDTLAAHLAGALGVPAWLMLQYEADWRWMHGREDSPWYPSLRLFRQTKPGDWKSVQVAVIKALELRVAEAKAQRAYA